MAENKPERMVSGLPKTADEFVELASNMWRKLKGVEPTEEDLAVFRERAERKFGKKEAE